MTKKTAVDATTSTALDFLDSVLEETPEIQYEQSPIQEAGIRSVKCYNVMPWQKSLKSLEWQLLYAPAKNEEVFWAEIEGSILAVRKSWDGYIDTNYINKEWKQVKEYYFTNQLGIYEANWVLFKWLEWNNTDQAYENRIIWTWPTTEFLSIITEPKSKFFKEMKKTIDWKTEYAESFIGKKITVYIKTDKWIIALNPWASYWKYNNVKEGTLEWIKWEAAKELKKIWKDFKKASLEICRVKWKIVKDWNYYIIKWELLWFIDESVMSDRLNMQKLIMDTNSYNFKHEWNIPLLGSSNDMEKALGLQEAKVEVLPF